MTTGGPIRPARGPGSRGFRSGHDDQALALIAHDGTKADLVALATYDRDRLAVFPIVATATTRALLREKVGGNVTALLSGPMGGDAQIAALVVEGRVHAVLTTHVIASATIGTGSSHRLSAVHWGVAWLAWELLSRVL